MDSKDWLQKEAFGWKKEGIINENQMRKIVSKYSKKKKDDHDNHLITILSLIGSVLIGIGVIVFIASNWQNITKELKLAILFFSTIAIYLAGAILQDKNMPRIGESIILLGSLFTGATIFLTGQIFNSRAESHWLLLIWLIAIAPISYGFNSKSNLFLAMILLPLWMGFYGKLETASTFLFYGISLIGLSYLHNKTRYNDFKGVFKVFGLIFTLGMLYFLVVDEFRIVYAFGSDAFTYTFITIATLSIIVSLIVNSKLKDAKSKTHELSKNSKMEMGWMLFVYILSISLWLISIFDKNPSAFDNYEFHANMIYIIIFNLGFACLSFMTIMLGYFSEKASTFNIGIISFVLYIAYLYFTTLFAYIDKSLFFIIGGIIFLVGGIFLEKKRKTIIEQFKNNKRLKLN